MLYLVLDSNYSFASQVTSANCVYEIRNSFDLNSGEVVLEDNCVLRFVGGSLANGSLVGAETAIDSIANYELFSRITLKGSWQGDINDLYFHYDSSEQPTSPVRQDFSPILRYRAIPMR